MTIVGVVGDVRNAGLDRVPDEAIYQPLAMNPFHYIRLVARTPGDPWLLDRPVRRAIHAADPLVAIFHVQPMDDYVTSSMAQRRFALALMSAFGALALVLSVVGLYSVLSYSVSQRTPELGVRAALGATPGALRQLVFAHGLWLTAAGTLGGIVLAALTTRLLNALLFGVGASDAVTFAGAGALLACASLAGMYVPARRASRIDPLAAMRD
jgi:putative ABC transport system permease protein